MKKIYLKALRISFLMSGSVIAWYSVINSFIHFYNNEGTIFKVKDCIIPNPITTPCFWGATAFLLGVVWAIKIYKIGNLKEKNFLIFLAVCTLFAWFSFSLEVRGVTAPKGFILSPCPVTTSSPYTSACFFGSILFSLSFISTLMLSRGKRDLDE